MRCQCIWRWFLKLFRFGVLGKAERRTSKILWSSGFQHGKRNLPGWCWGSSSSSLS
jgi:hypothetical protein